MGKEGDRFIIATTDKSKGALKNLADKKWYETFFVPDDIWCRFSVLSYVGLIGLAMANIDIDEFIACFKMIREITMSDDLKSKTKELVKIINQYKNEDWIKKYNR